jgi:hypothetical protein
VYDLHSPLTCLSSSTGSSYSSGFPNNLATTPISLGSLVLTSDYPSDALTSCGPGGQSTICSSILNGDPTTFHWVYSLSVDCNGWLNDYNATATSRQLGYTGPTCTSVIVADQGTGVNTAPSNTQTRTSNQAQLVVPFYLLPSETRTITITLASSLTQQFTTLSTNPTDGDQPHSRFSLMQTTQPTASTTYFTLTVTAPPALTSVTGDPLFVGLLGQRYQVHGVDGFVYSLISDRLVQVNTRFTYLDQGECVKGEQGQSLFTCWSHPGSYLSALAVQTVDGHRVLIQSGKARQGFQSVTVNGQQLTVGDSVTPRQRKDSEVEPLTVELLSVRRCRIAHAGLYSMEVENSDGFVNIVSLTVSDWSRLRSDVQSHGLVGQTWRRGGVEGKEVKVVEGWIDDYAERDNELWGNGFTFNQFALGQ